MPPVIKKKEYRRRNSEHKSENGLKRKCESCNAVKSDLKKIGTLTVCIDCSAIYDSSERKVRKPKSYSESTKADVSQSRKVVKKQPFQIQVCRNSI